MPDLYLALLTLALITACASILSEYRGQVMLRYLFKPLPALLMIVAVAAATTVPGFIRALFIAGLFCSAIGDLLLVNRQRFIWGLCAFLLAHIFYIFGIWYSLETAPRLLLILPLTLWGGVVFWILREKLGKLELPVLIYISVILAMVWLAIEYYYQYQSLSGTLLVSGAVAFALSDTVLSLDHFKSPFRSAKFWILSSYFLAQILIAMSIAIR